MPRKLIALILASSFLLSFCTKKEELPQSSNDTQPMAGGGPQQQNPRPQPLSTEIQDEKWNLHSDDQGFQIKIPDGWNVATQKNGVIQISGADSTSVNIWPFFIPAQQTADALFTSSLLQNLSNTLYPNSSWNDTEKISNTTARRVGINGTNRVVSILSVAASNRGISGILYSSAAPEQNYGNLQQTFAQMFESFKIIGVPVNSDQPQEPQIQYVRWQDPRESAFSVEVPSGWNTQGGLFRVSAIDVRAALQSVSPDNQIRINAGDTNIPIFSEPTPQGIALGFPEGSWYTPGPGATMMVRRYYTGRGFLLEYLTSTISQQCGGLQITQQRDRQDLVSNINAVYAQYNTGMTFTLDAGEATFQCQQGAVEGYYLAATKRTQAYGTGIWNVEYLYGFLATKDKAAQANKILGHIVNSSQLNPEWLRMQQGITANVSAITARTNQEISEIISSSYWQQQQTYDELSRRRSNANLGVQDVVDPTTGQEYKVESGSNYYWVDQRGTIVGTDTYVRPSIDFRELTQLP
jgi:hypothetical protein